MEPTNIWSSRNFRRRVAAGKLNEAQDVAEFGRRHRGRQGAMIALTALPVLVILGGLVAYFIKKPGAAAAASKESVIAEAASEKWKGAVPRVVVDNFLGATTLEERLRWVYSPETVRPLVAAFYTTGPGSREKLMDTTSLPPLPLGTVQAVNEVARFGVIFDDVSKRLLSIVETPQGAKVDFHSYSRHTSVPWPDILEGRVASAEVRVFIFPDNYHGAPFASEADWLSVKGINPDLPADLTLYARTGTPEAAAMTAALATAPQRVTITISPVGESWRQRLFQVTLFHAKEWQAVSPP